MLRLSGFVGLGRMLGLLGARELGRSLAGAAAVVVAVLVTVAMGVGIALLGRTSPELARLQTIWAAVGVLAFAIGASLPPRGWRLASGGLAVLGGALAGAMMVSGAGRFVNVGIPIAPLELAKPLLVVALVGCVARRSWLAPVAAAALVVALVPEPLTPVAHVEGIVSGVSGASGAPGPLTLLAIGAPLGIVVVLGAMAARSRQLLVMALAALVASELGRFALGDAGLPLVSYGGSSLVGVALAIGLAVRASREPGATLGVAR